MQTHHHSQGLKVTSRLRQDLVLFIFKRLQLSWLSTEYGADASNHQLWQDVLQLETQINRMDDESTTLLSALNGMQARTPLTYQTFDTALPTEQPVRTFQSLNTLESRCAKFLEGSISISCFLFDLFDTNVSVSQLHNNLRGCTWQHRAVQLQGVNFDTSKFMLP